jgi:phosphohistidine phosphatase
MPKTLVLVRHAKSSWDDQFLSDFDRPLNQRGKGDIPIMAGRLKHHRIQPDRIVHSAAVRTTQTTNGLVKELQLDCPVASMDSLYHAMKQTYLEVINQTPEDCNTLMVVGHNPTMTDLVGALSPAILDNLPTLGMCAIRFHSWLEVGQKKGDIQWLEYPRQFK